MQILKNLKPYINNANMWIYIDHLMKYKILDYLPNSSMECTAKKLQQNPFIKSLAVTKQLAQNRVYCLNIGRQIYKYIYKNVKTIHLRD